MANTVLPLLRRTGLLATLADANSSPKKKVVIEFSSPNIAKKFHVGNLRSTLIGNFHAKLSRGFGHEVHALNYLGDWGRQMAVIWAYWPHVRPSSVYWESASEDERVRLLTDCYVAGSRVLEDDEIFKEEVRALHERMEHIALTEGTGGDSLTEWREICAVSNRHLGHFYSLFNVHFDQWLRESQEVSRARDLVSRLVDSQGVSKDEGGALTLSLPGRDPLVLAKADGSTLYITRDVSSLLYRDSLFNADQYVYVVERAQRDHFIALRSVLTFLGREDLAQKVVHLTYGRVKGLSTRAGRTEAVSDIIESGRGLALEWMRASPTRKEMSQAEEEEAATGLAVSSLVFAELRRASKSDYEFNWRRTFDPSGGNNALFLHCKYSRLCSIEENNRLLLPAMEGAELSDEAGAAGLREALGGVVEAARESARSLESHHLANAVLAVGRESGRASSSLRVAGESSSVALPRLALLSLARRTLHDSMLLLGLPPLPRI